MKRHVHAALCALLVHVVVWSLWSAAAVAAVCFPDADGDGFGQQGHPGVNGLDPCVPGVSSDNNLDCNDGSAAVNPDAGEVCDGEDNDCDGQIDESFPSLGQLCASECGQGALQCQVGRETCVLTSFHPEVCDGRDNDCDGEIDEGTPRQLFFGDCDQDGVGAGVGVLSCGAPQHAPACATPLLPEDDPWVTRGDDCDDDEPARAPGLAEVCDGLDNDCDGAVDQGAEGTGQGCPISGQRGQCAQGQTACQDGALVCAQVNQPVAEVCGDVLDNDCDGEVDENLQTFCRDFDGDGYGNGSYCLRLCARPPGYVDRAGDCDDARPALNPDAQELCDFIDNDCDGRVDEGFPASPYYRDADGDGYGVGSPVGPYCKPYLQFTATQGGDCDDLDPARNPGAVEVCDGADDDCDGDVDEQEGLPLPCSGPDPGVCARGLLGCQSGVSVCLHPTPGQQAEVCGDGEDNDCDGEVDEDPPRWCRDQDGDGHGDPGQEQRGCVAPSGYVALCDDCDDARGAVYPGADEICDGQDNNCVDGIMDEAPGVWCPDNDGDGHGNPALSVVSCGPPPGHVAACDDCNDGRADAFPGNAEVCDGVDNNCVDGINDEGRQSFYRDADGDGFGAATSVIRACAAPSGYAANSADCNDANDQIYPGAPELCDGLDNNCQAGTTDEPIVRWCADTDGDGFGDVNVTSYACSPPPGYLADCNDCDDARDDTHPGAAEVCDGADNNCLAGTADEPRLTVYRDVDGDGFGVAGQALEVCARPPGYALAANDCLDSDDTAYPGAAELCDLVDNNCDGRLNEGCGCVPGAPEFCDGEDNDCDGDVDEGNPQGGGSCLTGMPGVCRVGVWVCDAGALRCDGAAPGTEICDGEDNDCDGAIDESFPAQNTPCGVVGALGPCAQGLLTCQDGAEVCRGPNPTAEVCDNIDNDCDGDVDDALARACSSSCGVGAETCEAGAWVGCSARTPSPEICDNVDNDCDGVADEAIVRACATTCGAGARVCSQGAFSSCSAPRPTLEVCDGEDNDCNGLIDDAQACGCNLVPDPGPPALQAEWTWTASGAYADAGEVISTPVAAHLDDDNLDGDINGLDSPEVIFVSARSDLGLGGVLRAVSGQDGVERWAWAGRSLSVHSSPAVADIDNDGFPEILAYVQTGGLVAIDHQGQELWFLPSVNPSAEIEHGSPAIANVDRFRPGAEIVSCFWLVSAQGELIWEVRSTMPSGYTPRGFCAPVVADVDDDGEVEVLIGARAFNHDGTILWSNNVLAGQWSGDYDIAPALADLNGDGEPELVVVRGDVFVLRARDGALLARRTIPGGGQGGAPALADLDGDGLPEIGVAGARALVAMKLVDDGGPLRLQELWSVETRDYSSSTTGVSAFDFNGDRRADLIYNDELYLRIVSGATGAVLAEVRNWTGAAVEYPVVADVDADGQAEVLVARNRFDDHYDDYGSWDGTPQAGLRAYGEANGAWVATRGVWNQYAWQGAHFEDDNTVPAGASRFWEDPGANQFRANAAQGQLATPAPDLAVEGFAVRQGAAAGFQPSSSVPWCPAHLEVDLEICNRGDVAIHADLEVVLALDDPEGARVWSSLERFDLDTSGPTRCVTVMASLQSDRDGQHRVYAFADAASVLEECDEDNNARSVGLLTLERPRAEVCDGVDNDCDAQRDEDQDGETLGRRCDVTCGAGTQTCIGGSWSVCSDAVVTESCDGVDNDCDDRVDEGTCPDGFDCIALRDGQHGCVAVQVVLDSCAWGCPPGSACGTDGRCVAWAEGADEGAPSASGAPGEPVACAAVAPHRAPASPWWLAALAALWLARRRQ